MMVAQHNLFYIENLMARIRVAIREGTFDRLRAKIVEAYPIPAQARKSTQ